MVARPDNRFAETRCIKGVFPTLPPRPRWVQQRPKKGTAREWRFAKTTNQVELRVGDLHKRYRTLFGGGKKFNTKRRHDELF